MTGHNINLGLRHSPIDATFAEFIHHSSGLRASTDTVTTDALRTQYPDLHLTVSSQYSCNLLAFAAAGNASCTPVDANDDTALKWRTYFPPARRLDGEDGRLGEMVIFEKYSYEYQDREFIVYLVLGTNGPLNYILSASAQAADELVVAVGRWAMELHNEVWVFDRGLWSKNAELWQSVQRTEWEDVILPKNKKRAITGDVDKFFRSRETYEKLKVPWKRGVIFHGPPGNGKTMSIKAMMHSLYKRKDPIPTLYVRSLAGFGGPETSLNSIFSMARRTAPCYLVFEDLDSIVSDNVRSYFLNQVDGLNQNDGIFMVGSTNHLDLLDPGIAKRPSRFDRKIYFPEPNLEERIQYCHYWQAKLADNKDIEFPDELCTAIAKITNNFSFAYIQEAFVAALLVIAFDEDDEELVDAVMEEQEQDQDVGQAVSDSGSDLVDVSIPADSDKGDDDDLDNFILWREIQKQIKLLREEMESEKERVTKKRVTAERVEMGIKRDAVRELQHGRYGQDC